MVSKTTGVIGTFAFVIVAISLGVFLTQDQIDNGYVCTANDNFGVFNGSTSHPAPLSGTNKSGYYVDDEGIDRRKTCRNGYWQRLQTYLDVTGLTLQDLVEFSGPDQEPDYVVSEVQDCYQHNISTTLYSHMENQTVACEQKNSTCGDFYIYPNKIYYSQNTSKQICIAKAVKIGKELILRKTQDTDSILTGDIFCVWDKEEGGSNLGHRSPYWKTHIKPGELGKCVNTTRDNSITKFKGRRNLE